MENMENTKLWDPKKNYFVLLLPPMAHKPNEGIDGRLQNFWLGLG
jgi:hypothetical protein